MNITGAAGKSQARRLFARKRLQTRAQTTFSNAARQRLARNPFQGKVLKSLRHIFSPHPAQAIANLAERDVVFHALDEERHQILRSPGGLG